MPRNNETAVSYFTQDGASSARTYFGRVVKGQSKVYDTPFARGESTENMLAAWSKILESIDDRWPTLVAFENELKSKVGPMSVMKPLKDRITDIDHYYDDILLSSEPVSEAAVAAAISEWKRVGGLRTRSQRRTVELMKKSTNSGNPYFTKRRNVVDRTTPCTARLIKNYVNQLLMDKDCWRACAILGWRGQEGGPTPADVKQRVIWMFPFAVNIRELQVYQPLIEAAQKFMIVPAWVSMEAVDARVTALFDTKADNDLVVCTDFSRFDQHFNADLQDCAQAILQRILTPDQNTTDWLNEVYPIKYNIPLMYNMGKLRSGRHGMGSGSGGTNADETLAHRTLQFEAAIRKGVKLNPNSQCLGDDGILTYPGITVKDVVESYSAHGQTMNLDKQYASTQDCVYLRRWHHKDYRIGGVCVGVYSTYRALGRLRYLERYYDPEVWSPEAVALRQLSIIENVKYHPLRDQFAAFCMKRDKYRLGIDIPGFLDNIEAYARETIELMPDFLGYTRTLQSGADETGGIKNWWIVNYLKSR